MKLSMVGILAVLMLSGCISTGPKSAVTRKVLTSGSPMVYIELSSQTPKEVALASYSQDEPRVKALGVVDPVEIGKLIGEILKSFPEMSKARSQERMNSVYIGRRILFVGYTTPEQLKKVKEIIKAAIPVLEPLIPEDK